MPPVRRESQSSLSASERALITRSRQAKGIALSDRELVRLLSVMLNDIGREDLVPPWIAYPENYQGYYFMPLDWFYGPATVLRIPKQAKEEITIADFKPFEQHLVAGARIIYNTGWYNQYGQANYFSEFPSLTQDAATYLANKGIRMLGMDTPTPSRDYYEVHHILLGKPHEIVVVESLANLDALPEKFTFIGFPLAFEGGDGSPIRAVALVS